MTDILALPNWAVLSVEQGDELIINAEYLVQPDCCLKCGSTSFYKHGPKPVSYRDSPVRGSPVVINAILKRYRCRDCGGTFIQQVEGMQPDMRMTERCYEYITSQALDDTFTRIAKNIGCDDKTVRSIAHEYITGLNETYEPNVAIAHNLKELFYCIYDQSSKEDAEKLLDEWIDIVPPEMKKSQKDFKPLLTAVKNWRKEILAFFDYPATNGYTEALNGVAKVINRQGRGYSFDVLRAKLLFRKMPDKEHFNHEKLRIMQVNHAVESTPRIEVIVRSNTSQIRRLLISKYESRCQSCLGVFTPQELWATWLDRKKDFSIENGTILCKPCRDRFDSTQS